MVNWQADLTDMRQGEADDSAVWSFLDKHMSNKSALRALFASVPRATVQFKVLCTHGKIPTPLVPVLVGLGKVDLAFHLAVCNEAWDHVVETYSHPDVRPSFRLLAFQKMASKFQWPAIVELAERSLLTPPELNEAFSAMVVNNQIGFAKRLYAISTTGDGNVPIPDHLLLLAIERCLHLRDCESAIHFMIHMENIDPSNAVLTQLVELTYKANAFRRLLILVNSCRKDIDLGRFLKSVFKGVLTSKGIDRLFAFSSSLVGCYFTHGDIQRLIMGALVETNNWRLLKNYRHCFVNNCDFETVCSCIKKMANNAEAREACGPIVESWFEMDEFVPVNADDFFRYFRKFITDTDLSVSPSDLVVLTDCLYEEGCSNLSFCLCLALHYWSTARRISRSESLNHVVCFYGVLKCLIAGQSKFLVTLLRKTDISEDIYNRSQELRKVLKLRRIPRINVYDALVQCNCPTLADWGLLIAVGTNIKEFVYFYADKCSDTDQLAFALEMVASENDVEALDTFVAKNRHQNVLPFVLMCMLVNTLEGDTRAIKSLLPNLDPCLIAYSSNTNHTILGSLLAEHARHTLPWVIQTGVSTREHSHLPCHKNNGLSHRDVAQSAMQLAVERRDLFSVKLFYKAGATTNREMFTLASNFNVIDALRNKGRGDIARVLVEKASTVRSLRDLSRLAVSHLIGCRPGRIDRVMSLGLSRDLNEYLMFEDCLCVEDC